ncbi:MAG: glycosyltransferase [Bacteroidetes bacterium]|nr:glycosyltransferase [Bacteroidota bacterium]
MRRKIGLLANFTEKWIGGLYYIQNLLCALNSLPDEEKPEIILFYHEATPTQLFDEVNYPYYKKKCLQSLPKWERALYKIARLINGKNYQLKKIFNKEGIESLFPIAQYNPELVLNARPKYWIFDFQHKFLPQYFSEKEIQKRDIEFEQIALNCEELVVSSYDAKSHFEQFYPESNAQVKVLRFISIIDFNTLAKTSIKKLRLKYNLGNKPYFLTSNQFWKHKNHIVILESLLSLKSLDFLMVFTGLEEDPRNPNYVTSLNQFITDNDLRDKVMSLGFISRIDQLCLLHNAVAAIQPSKFEGWNTFIEDSKSLNKKVIASKLSVHIEQLGDKGSYFETDNSDELSDLIKLELENSSADNITDITTLKNHALKKSQKFGRNILEIL